MFRFIPGPSCLLVPFNVYANGSNHCTVDDSLLQDGSRAEQQPSIMKKFLGLTGQALNLAVGIIAGCDFLLFGYGKVPRGVVSR